MLLLHPRDQPDHVLDGARVARAEHVGARELGHPDEDGGDLLGERRQEVAF